MGKIRITGMNSGLDTDAMVRELVNAYEKQGEKYTKKRTKTEWKQEAWTTLNNKINTFFSKQVSTMRFSSAYSKKKTSVSDSSKATVVTGNGAVNGTQSLEVKRLATSGYLTGGEIKKDKDGHDITVTKNTTLAELGFDIGVDEKKEIQIGIGTNGSEYSEEKGNLIKFEVDGSMTLDDVANLISTKEGLNATFDESTGRFFINSKESGAANNFEFILDKTGEGEVDEDSYKNKLLDTLGFIDKGQGETGGAVKISGENAQIVLNGATFESGTNNFSVNGLTITAKGVTSEAISLVTDADYDEIYDNIKNFIKEYNSLINEMDKLYNAPSSKGYEPLTSEEKEAMTDDEVKKWEAKIKDSLLRSDSELDTIASAMRNAMLGSFDIGGTKYSLSSFGINTLGYFNAAENEKNAYHIDGNSDDADTSGNEDKLRAMIASNPEVTAEFFQKLSKGLYDAMNKIQSASDSYTSYGKFFSDKKLQNEYVDQTKQIDKWEEYVAKQEDKYYKQFTAMESAMSSLNSQQSYISQLFAG